MSEKLKLLKRYQKWRRGDDKAMHQSPADIGQAIDYAISVIEAAEDLVKVKGRHNSELCYRALVDVVKGGGA